MCLISDSRSSLNFMKNTVHLSSMFEFDTCFYTILDSKCTSVARRIEFKINVDLSGLQIIFKPLYFSGFWERQKSIRSWWAMITASHRIYMYIGAHEWIITPHVLLHWNDSVDDISLKFINWIIYWIIYLYSEKIWFCGHLIHLGDTSIAVCFLCHCTVCHNFHKLLFHFRPTEQISKLLVYMYFIFWLGSKILNLEVIFLLGFYRDEGKLPNIMQPLKIFSNSWPIFCIILS